MKYKLAIPCNRTILAVDPSVRALGVALLWRWEGQVYIRLQTVYTPRLSLRLAADRMVAAVELFCPLHDVTDLVIEQPVLVAGWSDNKQANIRKLQAAVRRLQQQKPASAKAWYPTVSQWKGQLSKKVSAERTQSTLGATNLIIADPAIWDRYDHNAHDAAGLLVAYCKKQNWIEEIK